MARMKLMHKLFLFAASGALLAGCIAPPAGAPNAATPAVVTATAAAMTGTEAATPGMTASAAITPTTGITPTAAIAVPFQAIQLIFEYAPGARTPFHIHGGAGLATVLEGEVSVREQPNGAAKVYRAGEFYAESIGQIMSAGNDGQAPARVAAMFLLPKGATLTTVQDGTAMDKMPPGPTILYRNSMTVTTATQ